MPHAIRSPGRLSGAGVGILLAGVHVLGDATAGVVGGLLPTFDERLHIGPSGLAMLAAASWVAASLMQPVMGTLAEAGDPRRWAAAGIAGTGIALGLVGVATNVWMLVALLVAGGLASAALHAAGAGIVGSATTRGSLARVSVFTTGGMIGLALGPALILWLVDRQGLPGTAWLIPPSIGAGALTWFLLPRFEPHGRSPLRSLGSFDLLLGPIGLLVAAGALASLAFLAFVSAMPLLLVSERGLAPDDALIGWTLAVFSLAGGLGAMVGGALSAVVGRVVLVAGSLAAATIPFVASLAVEPGTGWFLALTGAAGALVTMNVPVTVRVAQELASASPAAASGLVLGLSGGVAGGLYAALGPLQAAGGMRLGMGVAFATLPLAAALAALALGASPLAAMRRRRDRGRQTLNLDGGVAGCAS